MALKYEAIVSVDNEDIAVKAALDNKGRFWLSEWTAHKILGFKEDNLYTFIERYDFEQYKVLSSKDKRMRAYRPDVEFDPEMEEVYINDHAIYTLLHMGNRMVAYNIDRIPRFKEVVADLRSALDRRFPELVHTMNFTMDGKDIQVRAIRDDKKQFWISEWSIFRILEFKRDDLFHVVDQRDHRRYRELMNYNWVYLKRMCLENDPTMEDGYVNESGIYSVLESSNFKKYNVDRIDTFIEVVEQMKSKLKKLADDTEGVTTSFKRCTVEN